MIVYFVKRGFGFTISEYFESWGKALDATLDVVHYQDLPNLSAIRAGTYIFSDVERLSPVETTMAGALRQELAGQVDTERLLNDPHRTLRRYDLLRLLSERGVNRFGVHRLSADFELPDAPVFLRHETHHLGPLSQLLTSREQLEAAVTRACLRGFDPARLILVEFCDTSGPDGLFRKYSAFVVRGHIVPREVAFSTHWAIQDVDILDVRLLSEEREYLESNPHAQQLLEIARLAGVQYGRFDYGLIDGRPQVWEINTNPIVMRPPQQYRPDHLRNQQFFANRIGEVLEDVDSDEDRLVEIHVTRPARRSVATMAEEVRDRAALAHHWASKGRSGGVVDRGLALAERFQRLVLWLVGRRLSRIQAESTRA